MYIKCLYTINLNPSDNPLKPLIAENINGIKCLVIKKTKTCFSEKSLLR